jgi:hypothetical protein
VLLYGVLLRNWGFKLAAGVTLYVFLVGNRGLHKLAVAVACVMFVASASTFRRLLFIVIFRAKLHTLLQSRFHDEILGSVSCVTALSMGIAAGDALLWPGRAVLWIVTCLLAVFMRGPSAGIVLTIGGGWVALLAKRLHQPAILALGVIPVAAVAARAKWRNLSTIKSPFILRELKPESAAAMLTIAVAMSSLCAAILEDAF